MGERRDIPQDMPRYTVRDAADMLGITTGAVRNRLSRGTLQSFKEGGKVYVLLPADTPRDTERDTDRHVVDTPGGMPDPLVDELRDRLRYVEGQLDAEREANRENRRIIAGLIERVPQLEAPRDEQNQAESTEPRSDRGTDSEAAEKQGKPTERRPWWRRIFGS